MNIGQRDELLLLFYEWRSQVGPPTIPRLLVSLFSR